jgi:hypothetical protein
VQALAWAAPLRAAAGSRRKQTPNTQLPKFPNRPAVVRHQARRDRHSGLVELVAQAEGASVGGLQSTPTPRRNPSPQSPTCGQPNSATPNPHTPVATPTPTPTPKTSPRLVKRLHPRRARRHDLDRGGGHPALAVAVAPNHQGAPVPEVELCRVPAARGREGFGGVRLLGGGFWGRLLGAAFCGFGAVFWAVMGAVRRVWGQVLQSGAVFWAV